MARLKDEGRGVAPKVGAAAFGVALTLPMGLAAPADAMNACACGGGGSAPPADAPENPGPTSTPGPAPQAPPRRPVSPPPTGPPPGTTVRGLENETPAPEPAPAPEPPRGGHPTRPAGPAPAPVAEGGPGGHPTRPAEPAPPAPAQEGPRGGHPTRPAEPAPPAPAQDGPRGGHPTRPAEPAPAPVAEGGPGGHPTRPAEPAPPAPAQEGPRGGHPTRPAKPGPAPEPPAGPPRGGHPTQPEPPHNAVDELIDSVTDPTPQPEPPRYLSDLMLPGVDLGTQPAPPPPQYAQPRPQRPGESGLEYLLTSPLDEPRPEPKPIGPAPDLSELDPIARDEFVAENPMSQPFYTEAERAAARQRLSEDELVVDDVLSPADDRNPARNELRMEHADPLPPPPEPEPEGEGEGMSGMDYFQEGLSYGGFIPGLGAVPDLINAPIYAVRGKWGEAAWSLGAAVPLAGDAANGVRKGRKIYGAVDEAVDAGRTVDNAMDARRVVSQGSPEAATNKFLSTRPKIDSSDESVAALDAIMRRTTSGTRANASHPGKFNPVHTRGHSAELRTLDDLAARSDVTSITPVPAARGSRTPDFVVTRADGSQVRVEVTTVTGAPPGRAERGLGGAAPPTRRDIENAITRKTGTSSSTPNQFQADLGDVPTGGTLAVHLRGGGTAQMADDAVAARAANLRKSGVDSVEIYTSDRQVLTYTRQPDGTFRR